MTSFRQSPLSRCLTPPSRLACRPSFILRSVIGLAVKMCSLTPSVTLYGTTQVPTVRTIVHTITETQLGDPVITETSVTTTQCDSFGLKCGPQIFNSAITLTPTVTAITTSVEIRTTIAASVIPQQTLYYPCTFGATSESIQRGEGRESRSTSETRLEEAPTFDTPVPQPQPTPPPFTPTSQSTISISVTSAAASTSTSKIVVSSSATSSTTSSLPVRRTSSSISSSQLSSTSFSSSFTGISAAAPSVSSSTANKGAIAGGIIGGIVGMIALCALITYLRRARSHDRRESRVTVLTDYWERRFRALEAEGEDSNEKGNREKGISTTNDEDKKIRLTLDLKSKGMSDRPASRLSLISSFFSSRPQPVQINARSGGPLNFSRPHFGHRRQSSKGSVNTKASKTSRKSRALSERTRRVNLEEHDEYNDGYMGGPIVINRESYASDGRMEGNERRAMEWIRPATVVDDDIPSTPSLLPTHNPSSKASNLGRQLTPPKRSASGSISATSLESCLPSARAATGPVILAPYPARERELLQSKPNERSQPTLGRGTSYLSTREARGKPVPTLPLSREAITPSLWIDEDPYEEFRQNQESRFSLDSSAAPSAMGRSEDPYGGLATSPAPRTSTSSPTTAASTTGSFGNSVGVGYVVTPAKADRSAVTPQLPVFPVEGGSSLGIDWDHRVRSMSY